MKRKWQPAVKAFASLLLLVAGFSKAFSQQGIITTVAGGGPNSASALSADIAPTSVAVDASGNMFLGQWAMHQVIKIDSAGHLAVVAGTGAGGFGGDGGPATSASLNFPEGVAVDAQGNLFIADTFNSRIRRVDAATGIITTVAGNGQSGYSGDGGPATSASLAAPTGLALDAQGNMFIADNLNNRIRRVDVATGTITTVAGNGQPGYSGDGGPATSASLAAPGGVALDAQGNLFIADAGNARVRRVDAATGTITTVAGNGQPGDGGDGGPATSAHFIQPEGVVVDAQGNLFIADSGSGRIRRVDAMTGIITTVAGNGSGGFSGDGGPATSAALSDPAGVALDAQDNLFIADSGNGRVRRVEAATAIVTTVAGGGSGGDGGPATSAILVRPDGVAPDSSGNVFIADTGNVRIRHVDAATGIITTVAGSGSSGYGGDGGPATSAILGMPEGVAADAQSDLFIADTADNLIRRVDATTGIITTVAGNGSGGFSGDNGPATSASLNTPEAVALDAQGNLFIAESSNQRVRRVDAVSGIITTVAGNGTQGFSGDGGPATSASLALPYRLAVDAQGNLFIAEAWNGDIRRVDAPTGIITTVSSGLNSPSGVAVDAQGNLFIADTKSYQILRVDAVSGATTTVAGDGSYGYNGDGGPAGSASLGQIEAVAVDAHGRLLIADSSSDRTRVVPLPPFVALSAAGLSLAAQPIGMASPAQTVTLTNTGMVALAISSLTLAGTNAGDFAQTNTCGGSLRAGANCAINVTFTPTAAGSRTATLTIIDNASGSLQTVTLSGAEKSPDFSVAAAAGSSTWATVTAGQTATYDLGITPLGGLSGTVSLTCAGAPAAATCAVNPSSVSLSGSDVAPITVTVTTTARSAVGMRPKPPAGPWIWLLMLGWLAAVGAKLMGGRRPVWRRAWASLGVVMLSLMLWTACGGSGAGGGGGGVDPGTPAGAYTLTVSGTYASGTTTLQHNITLTLKVN
jgi:trimeric autotransporter adhesin